MRKSVIELIGECLLGKRYYACVVNTRGTSKCEMACYIFDDREAVERYKRGLMDNLSYQWVETITFRSRKEYKVIHNS